MFFFVYCRLTSPHRPYLYIYIKYPFLVPLLILPFPYHLSLPSPGSCPPAHLCVGSPHPGRHLQGEVRGGAAPGAPAAPPQPPGAFPHCRGSPGAGEHAVSSPRPASYGPLFHPDPHCWGDCWCYFPNEEIGFFICDLREREGRHAEAEMLFTQTMQEHFYTVRLNDNTFFVSLYNVFYIFIPALGCDLFFCLNNLY